MRGVARAWSVGVVWVGLNVLLLLSWPQARADEKPHPSAHWEPQIQAFEQRDKETPPPRDAVLFVGSSSIRLWNLATSFPDMKAINRGFGGSFLSDSAYFARRIVTPCKPRMIVLYAGDNDLAAGKSPEQVCEDFREFVRTVRAELPETPILYVSIKPSVRRVALLDQMRNANALIAAECAKGAKLTFVDVFTPMLDECGKPRRELFIFDGLHMNVAGYQLWKSVLEPHLNGTAPRAATAVQAGASGG